MRTAADYFKILLFSGIYYLPFFIILGLGYAPGLIAKLALLIANRLVIEIVVFKVANYLRNTFEKLKAFLRHPENFEKNRCKLLYHKMQILNWITFGAVKSMLKIRNINLEKEELLKSTIKAGLSHQELLSRARFLVKELKIKPCQQDIEDCFKKKYFMTAGYLLNQVSDSNQIIRNIAVKYQTPNRSDLPESQKYSKEYIEDFIKKWKTLGRIYVPSSDNNIPDQSTETSGPEIPSNAAIFRTMLTDIPQDPEIIQPSIDPESSAANRDIQEITNPDYFLEDQSQQPESPNTQVQQNETRKAEKPNASDKKKDKSPTKKWTNKFQSSETKKRGESLRKDR